MKKLLLLATFAVSTAAMAQTTVLWDGESSEVGSDGGWWDRGKPTVVENPDKSGINTSDKCLKFTMTGNDFGQKHLALPFRDWMTGDNQLNLNGRRRVSMMIKKTNNENVEIELSDPTNGDPEQWKHTAAWYGSAGAWQKLVFDYSTNEGLTECPGVLAITASTGNVTANEDVYVDKGGAERMCVVGHVLRPLYVLVVRRARTVVHHGRIAPGERVRRLLHGVAVVQVERNGDLAAEGEALQHPAQVVRLPGVEEAHVELDDDGLVLGFGGLKDCRGRFVVRDVERAHGLVGLVRGVQHLLHVD